ncbi:MAG: hypothetical protein R6W83_10835 [Cryobacterium sp.]
MMVTLALALALDRSAEDRLLAGMLENGHSVLARAQTAAALIEALRRVEPQVVIVAAHRETLTAELIAACDDRGVRVIALAGGAQDRRHAAGLGLYEVVDAGASWAEIELLLGSGAVPLRVGGPRLGATDPP